MDMFNLSSYYNFASPWYTPSLDQPELDSDSAKHAMNNRLSSSETTEYYHSPESTYPQELYRSSSSSSASSSSSSSSAELATPPASPSSNSTPLQWSHHHNDSPQFLPLDDIKGKGKQRLQHIAHPTTRDNTPLALTMNHNSLRPAPPQPSSTTVVAASQRTDPASTAASASLKTPPHTHIPSRVQPVSSQPEQPRPQPPPPASAAAAAATPISRSAPSAGSREYDELRRGRSRWPRLLWRSGLDKTSLDALGMYHARAVGGPLPVLPSVEEARQRPGSVKQWSLSMEKAGL